MSCSLILPAPAKLNLFLHITGKRADGYHNLQTLFIFLDYGDLLTFTPVEDEKIVLESPIPGIAAEDNLIYRAAKCLEPYRKKNCGVRIDLDKRLPMGGGLGGGSSDAATTLLAVNLLWKCGLSEDELAALGCKLGADVPVFVRCKASFAQGVGEILQPVELPEKWYLVIAPEVQVSTKEIFSHPDLVRDTPVKNWQELATGSWHNDCENLVKKLYEPVAKSLDWLVQYAPSRMTGTGACVFGEFADYKSASQALDKVPSTWRAFVARGCCQSPLREKLDSYLQGR